MKDLEKLIDQLTVKAVDITNFCNIVGNETWKSDVLELKSEISSIRSILESAKQTLTDHPNTMKTMRAALYELRRQDIIMKCVLERTEGSAAQVPPQDGYSTPTRPLPSSQAPQSTVKKIQWDKRTISFQPPPPSSTKKCGQSPVSLDHFAYTITEKEFNTIPKYLRGGREQLADLQRIVDEIICPCLIEKYTILNKPSAELVNVNLRQLQRLFKDQEGHFPGQYFITEGDIARFTAALIDKRLRNRIQMLRQLGLVKEVRKNSSAFYMWMIRVEGLDDRKSFL